MRPSITSAIWSNTPVRHVRMLDKLPTIKVDPDPLEIEDKPISQSKTSQAMKEYLDRVSKYTQFMDDQRTEFAIGKRHLANMMGRDPETFTQEDIDESIEYLFPCGVYDRNYWPKMKPPEEVFPARKEAEFDVTGRPYHFLFYTGQPSFNQILRDAADILDQLYQMEDRIIRGEEPDPKYTPLPLETSSWVDRETLEKEVKERLHEKDYEKFTTVMNRVAQHKYARKFEEFVYKHRKFFVSRDGKSNLDGKFVPCENGRRKYVITDAKKHGTVIDLAMTHPGTGQFRIDSKDIRFFANVVCREAILFPLVLTNMVNKVDVEVDVKKNTEIVAGTKLALHIRYVISQALSNFVDEASRDNMTLAGLLQRPIQYKERKKTGQEGARRRFAWVKR